MIMEQITTDPSGRIWRCTNELAFLDVKGKLVLHQKWDVLYGIETEWRPVPTMTRALDVAVTTTKADGFSIIEQDRKTA